MSCYLLTALHDQVPYSFFYPQQNFYHISQYLWLHFVHDFTTGKDKLQNLSNAFFQLHTPPKGVLFLPSISMIHSFCWHHFFQTSPFSSSVVLDADFTAHPLHIPFVVPAPIVVGAPLPLLTYQWQTQIQQYFLPLIAHLISCSNHPSTYATYP